MSESYGDPQKGRNRGGPREGRGSGNREGGGFRIRLSDNEMRASRAIQEAFNLRSTVAVLGFALRTLGQMLEDGKLDSLISEYRSQNSNAHSIVQFVLCHAFHLHMMFVEVLNYNVRFFFLETLTKNLNLLKNVNWLSAKKNKKPR